MWRRAVKTKAREESQGSLRQKLVVLVVFVSSHETLRHVFP